MARNDLFTSDVSPPGSAVPRLLESQAVAQLAPVPDSAPVPPQNLEAEESVLGAMMLSPLASMYWFFDAHELTAGLNWYWNHWIRWQANYGFAVIDGGPLDGRLHVFQARFQLTL